MAANKTKLGSALIVLTLSYFAIELILNTTVYGMLSYSNDALVTSSMELWGKVIAGLGLALIATRVWISTRFADGYWSSNKDTYLAFFWASVVSIPLSFVIQDKLIVHVLKNADTQDFNKAVLINAAHNTLVPVYRFEGLKETYEPGAFGKLVYPFSRFSTDYRTKYQQNRKLEVAVRGWCADKSAKQLGFESRLEKAFFPYKALLTGFNEDLYKQAIKDHYVCAYNDDQYFDSRSKGNINQIEKLDELFDKYYLPNVIHHQKYSIRKPSNANKEWREVMNRVYGFKTSIKPNTQSYFLDHADTRRLYAEKTGITEAYPGDDDFREDGRALIEKGLPGLVLGGSYMNDAGYKDPTPSYMKKARVAAGKYEGITKYQRIEIGVQAYKSIMMPIIALGLSAFFLILNLVLALTSIVARLGDRFGWHPLADKAFLAVALVWFIFWPLVKGGDEYAAFKNSEYKPVAKWLYYHEGNLASIYQMALQGVGNSGESELDEKSVDAGEMESTSPDLEAVSNEDSGEDRRPGTMLKWADRRDTNRKADAVSEKYDIGSF